MNEPMHVAAGVLLDATGRVLLAQRPPGKHLAGLWEFPGGKLERGESVPQALARELHEELGIEVAGCVALVQVPWSYGERDLVLHAWHVRAWRGEPAALEGQALQWVLPERVQAAELAPADRVILRRVCEVSARAG